MDDFELIRNYTRTLPVRVQQINQYILSVKHHWLEILSHGTVDEFIKNGNPNTGELFICRTNELLSGFRGLILLLLKDVPNDVDPINRLIVWEFHNNLMTAFKNFADSLLEEEHIVLDYMRQSYTHVFQNGYNLEKITDTRGINSLNGKQFNRMEAHKVIYKYYNELFIIPDRFNQDKAGQYYFAQKLLRNFYGFLDAWSDFYIAFEKEDCSKYLVNAFNASFAKQILLK